MKKLKSMIKISDRDRKLLVLLLAVAIIGLAYIFGYQKLSDKVSKYQTEITSLQKKLLEVNEQYVKEGGILVYSTCTLNKKENEKVVEKFLKSNPDFSLVKQKTIFPSSDGGDGFFYALMVKHND